MWRWEVGDSIELRGPEEQDVDELFALIERNRPRLARWQHWAHEGRQKDYTANFIRAARVSLVEETAFNLLIWRSMQPDRQKIIGSAGLLLISPSAAIGEIGYWIDEAWEGQGIVTRCVRTLIEEGFEKRRLERIQIRCAPGNTRSSAIPRRLGFLYEGTLRRVLRVGEDVQDLESYSLLRPEWEACRQRTT